MRDDLLLRPFKPADADVVVSWLRSADDAVAVAGARAPWPYRAADLVRASREAGRSPFTVTSTVDPTAVLGHVAVVVVTPTAGRLARVVLAPHLRGRGRSGRVLALAVAEAQRVGLRELTLFVVPGNVAATRAYEAAGFRVAPADPQHPEYVRMTRTV